MNETELRFMLILFVGGSTMYTIYKGHWTDKTYRLPTLEQFSGQQMGISIVSIAAFTISMNALRGREGFIVILLFLSLLVVGLVRLNIQVEPDDDDWDDDE